MKHISYCIRIKGVIILLTCLSVIGCLSCQNDDESMNSVDLRYNSQSSYLLPAKDAEEVVFEVKSTKSWNVHHQTDWCTVSPDQGPAGEVCKVTLRFKDNNNLDDRTDTVTIQSDYWIGKRFTVTQKGIAFLNVTTTNPIVMAKEAGNESFTIESNQNWTSQVTQGKEWLSITEGESGTLNGQVKVQVLVNKGEQRLGEVTVFDRHGVKQSTVNVTQEGVLLQPEMEVIKTLHESKVLHLKVESNAEWSIRQLDPDQEWFRIPVTSFNGNAEIEIQLDENTGVDTRVAELELSTKSVEGIQPVVKRVILKQGNNPETIRYEFIANDLNSRWMVDMGTPRFNGDAFFEKARVTQNNCPAGTYSFRIKEMSADAWPVLYFTFEKKELRWHIYNNSTNISTSPWSPMDSKNISIDMSKPHTVTLKLSDKEGFMFIEWILDGETFASLWANGEIMTIESGAKALVYFGCPEGSALYDWYEYTPLINWGE